MSAALTLRAVERWVLALGAETYDVRLVHEGGNRAILRRVAGTELLRWTGWLRAMNAQGFHVFGRPLAPRYVMLDDLGPDELAHLRRCHDLAAVLETSPANHQAWITLSDGLVEPAVGSAAARLLAARFGADPGAANSSQVGRLPGFTNRKQIHRRHDGSLPWVRLLHAEPHVDAAGAAVLREVIELPLEEAIRFRSGAHAADIGEAEWLEAARRVAATLPDGTVVDRSRVDAAIAKRQLRRGISSTVIEQIILSGSKARSVPHERAVAYARRTVAAAALTLRRG